jgi:hypothetical protein
MTEAGGRAIAIRWTEIRAEQLLAAFDRVIGER